MKNRILTLIVLILGLLLYVTAAQAQTYDPLPDPLPDPYLAELKEWRLQWQLERIYPLYTEPKELFSNETPCIDCPVLPAPLPIFNSRWNHIRYFNPEISPDPPQSWYDERTIWSKQQDEFDRKTYRLLLEIYAKPLEIYAKPPKKLIYD